MTTNENEPAFPCNSPDGNETYKGMTLRDYFAGQALMGMIASNSYPVDTRERYAEVAYEYADAMLKARGK